MELERTLEFGGRSRDIPCREVPQIAILIYRSNIGVVRRGYICQSIPICPALPAVHSLGDGIEPCGIGPFSHIRTGIVDVLRLIACETDGDHLRRLGVDDDVHTPCDLVLPFYLGDHMCGLTRGYVAVHDGGGYPDTLLSPGLPQGMEPGSV